MACSEKRASGSGHRRAGADPAVAVAPCIESPAGGGGTAPATSAVALDLLRAGHAVRFTARGRSMRPFICDGDVLTVEPLARVRVRRGDVLFYSRPEGAGAHRLLGFRMESGRRVAIIRGDITGLWTEAVEWPAIAGVVVAAHRRGRRIYGRSVADRVAGLAWAYGRGLGMKTRMAGCRLKRACLRPRTGAGG